MPDQTLVVKDELIIKDEINKKKKKKKEEDGEENENIIPESIEDVEGLEYL